MALGDVIEIASGAIWLVIKCSAPMLLSSLIVGLIVSIFQTVTSIQEQTLTFVPKLLTIFLMIIITGDWIFSNILNYMQDIFSRFGDFVR